MDSITGILLYKKIPISICFGKLSKQEQYECIRMIFATRPKDVKICCCGVTGDYLQKLVLLLGVEQYSCQEPAPQKVLLEVQLMD